MITSAVYKRTFPREKYGSQELEVVINQEEGVSMEDSIQNAIAFTEKTLKQPPRAVQKEMTAEEAQNIKQELESFSTAEQINEYAKKIQAKWGAQIWANKVPGESELIWSQVFVEAKANPKGSKKETEEPKKEADNAGSRAKQQ